MNLPELDHNERWAEKHPDQHKGCIACKQSHHITAFCKCGGCFFKGLKFENTDFGDFVTCPKCGERQLWD